MAKQYLQLDAKALHKKLVFAQGGVSRKPVASFFGEVLLTVSNNTLVARSFNNVAHTIVKVCETDLPEGSMALNMGRTVRNLAKVKGVVRLTLDWDAPSAKFVAGKARWTEHGQPGELFPSRPKGLPEAHQYAFSLAPAMTAAASVLDPKNPLDYQRGVRLESNGNLVVIGTDSISMSIMTLAKPIRGFEGEVTIPEYSVEQIGAVFGMGSVDVGVNKSWVTVRHEDFFVASLTGDKKYPDCHIAKIKAGESFDVIVDRANLLTALSITSAYADPDNRGVKLHIHNDGSENVITITGSSKLSGGDAEMLVPCECEETDFKVIVDYKRLMDAVRGVSGEEEVKLMFGIKEAEDWVDRRLAISPTEDDAGDHLWQTMLLRDLTDEAAV